MNFDAHIETTRTKAGNVMMKLASLTQKNFKIPLEVTRKYMMAILVGILGYGAGIWAHKAKVGKNITLLRRIQRQALLRCIGIVSATSTMAIFVTLAIWPIDFIIRMRGALYWLNKNQQDRIINIIGKICSTR